MSETLDLELLQPNLLEILVYFHDFCEAHGLEYFLVGGTLLGAVRHNGFIPWDDDIDVVMKRDDYEKLLKLYQNIESPFQLRDYSNEKDYLQPFARLVNNNLIVEQYAYIPFRSGVWLDIFPLDYTFENLQAQRAHFAITRLVRVLLAVKSGAFNKGRRSTLRVNTVKKVHQVLNLVPRSTFLTALKFLERAPNKYLGAKSNLANLYGVWNVKETAPVELFENRKLYNFEGYKFWSVKDSDFWLSKVYGDYMTLPPENERTPKHYERMIKINHDKLKKGY